MAKYIPLDALVAEIIRRRKAIPKDEDDTRLQAVYGNEAFVLTELLEYIDTLEVKEVDFEKVFNDEYSKFSNDTDAMDYAFPIDLADFKDFAKHFFELGIKAQKGE